MTESLSPHIVYTFMLDSFISLCSKSKLIWFFWVEISALAKPLYFNNDSYLFAQLGKFPGYLKSESWPSEIEGYFFVIKVLISTVVTFLSYNSMCSPKLEAET